MDPRLRIIKLGERYLLIFDSAPVLDDPYDWLMAREGLLQAPEILGVLRFAYPVQIELAAADGAVQDEGMDVINFERPPG